MSRSWLLAVGVVLCNSLYGCEGATGPEGPAGARGTSGTDGTNGTNGSNGSNGANGQACWDLNNNGAADLAGEDQNGDGLVNVADCATQFPLEPAGVVGMVTDAADVALGAGTVYFVPAADVAALPALTVAVNSTNDEPLEDLIAASGATYQSATVDTGGRYALTTLAAGSYFVTFVPGAGDTGHLPGGSACRTAMAFADLVGQRLDVEVSSAIPSDAYFVGSGACVSCHGRTHIAETMHRIGIWSSYESGILQDFGPRFDDLYQAIDTKFDVGTTVWFYDYDSTRGFDKYKTLETDPATGTVAFTVTVQRGIGGDLEMLFHNVQNGTDPDRVYRVDLVYGGGVMKQRYMTRLANGFGWFHAMLPLQFQNEGLDGAPYGRTSKVWRDYNGYKWYDEATDTFKEPVAKDSFEKNCVSCHAVGAQVTGSDTTVWTASLVEDRFYRSGDVDVDGDGVAEELNLGCETCHGPGSRHWESAGQGKHIVSPSLLTPEREAMICGQCHSRPKGALNTDSPVNAAGFMMVAGTSRNAFLASYATSQLDGAASDYYTDVDLHSKSHHQQYSDFIRSGMYRNATHLMTCASCHDPHQRTAHARQLKASPLDNAAICGTCHATQSGNLTAHLTEKFNATVAVKASVAKCVDCHMPKTAKTGAGQPGALLQGTQYWMNDVTSHLFKVPNRALATSQAMPVPYTSACGTCHTAAP